MTTVVIPNNVVSLGDRAFYDCDHLSYVILGKKVSTIGERCFNTYSNGNYVLKTVTSLNTTAPSLGNDAFYVLPDATLQVPQNCAISYINSGYVNYFDNIVEIDPSAIKGVTMDKKRNASIYNLNGVKLNEVHKGINIIGGKKVVIR